MMLLLDRQGVDEQGGLIMSKLSVQVQEHIAAGFAGVYVTTNEPDDAQRDIMSLCQSQGWEFHAWDADSGLDNNPDMNDPGAVIKAVVGQCPMDKTTVLVMRYFQRMLTDNIMLVTITENALREGKVRGFYLVILAPDIALPVELSRSFVVLEHALPTREELHEIGTDLEQSYPNVMPQGSELETLLDAAQGLTRGECENAYSLSIIRHKRIQADEVFRLKAQSLTKTGFLRLSESKRTFDDLGGLANIKDFCLRVLGPNPKRIGNPKGVLALGPPGTGKTAFSEALGNAVGLPTVILDLGALKGSLVGQSEERTRQAIATINAMGRCIVFLDEAEKSLAGSGGNGNLDSGVQAGMFGTLLTWLSDPNRQAFVIATSNDIRGIPAAFSRSGRFDGVFCWDLPAREQKDAIWSLYVKRYGLDADQEKPADKDWTGADIESCCQKANSLGISLMDASMYVVPVAIRAAQDIENLRSYCDGTTISADYPGLYRRNPEQAKQATASKPIRRLDLN